MCKKKCNKCKLYLKFFFGSNKIAVSHVRDSQDLLEEVGLPIESVYYTTCHEYRKYKDQLQLNLGGDLCYGNH